MSVEAITWALTQRVERSSAKFVLVALANCANNDGTCWPSMSYVCEATEQDRKTVLENIKRLKEWGFIEATGEHRGATGQIAIYRLNIARTAPVEQSQKRNSTESGTVPKTDSKSPENGQQESRFPATTVPKTGHGTVRNHKEPSGNQKKSASAPVCVSVAVLVEAGFDATAADEFIAHKSAMKAPLTARAWADHLAESRKAGWSPAAAADKVMAKSWKGFEARYVASEPAPGRPAAFTDRKSLQLTTAALMTGTSRQQSTEIIDVTPRILAAR